MGIQPSKFLYIFFYLCKYDLNLFVGIHKKRCTYIAETTRSTSVVSVGIFDAATLFMVSTSMVTCSHYKPGLGGLALACNPPSQAKSPISAGFWPGLAWEFRAWPGGLQGLRPGQQITIWDGKKVCTHLDMSPTLQIAHNKWTLYQ